jgi:hypothetical protein
VEDQIHLELGKHPLEQRGAVIEPVNSRRTSGARLSAG